MSESVYKVIELVGTSSESWEKAAAAAVGRAAQTLRGLRVAEVVELDMTIEDNAIALYRARSASRSSTRAASSRSPRSGSARRRQAGAGGWSYQRVAVEPSIASSPASQPVDAAAAWAASIASEPRSKSKLTATS